MEKLNSDFLNKLKFKIFFIILAPQLISAVLVQEDRQELFLAPLLANIHALVVLVMEKAPHLSLTVLLVMFPALLVQKSINNSLFLFDNIYKCLYNCKNYIHNYILGNFQKVFILSLYIFFFTQLFIIYTKKQYN